MKSDDQPKINANRFVFFVTCEQVGACRRKLAFIHTREGPYDACIQCKRDHGLFSCSRLSGRGQLTKHSFMVGVTERALRSTQGPGRQPPKPNSLEKRFAFGSESGPVHRLGHMSSLSSISCGRACTLEKDPSAV